MTGRRPKLSTADALAARPVRLVDAVMQARPDGGGSLRVTLAAPPRRRWLFRFPAGTTKTFEFDAIGVFVWDALDGRTTVETLIERLAARYHLSLREAQVPTAQFLQTLMKKGLVGIVGPQLLVPSPGTPGEG